MKLFFSRSVHKVDKKRRVSVPAGFRSALGDALGEGLALHIPLAAVNCIEAQPLGALNERMAQLERLNADRPEVQALLHQLIGNMSPVTFDAEGRINLPDYLADYAGITDTATFVGMGRSFQIWQPDALAAHDVRMREVARDHIHLLDKAPRGDAPDGDG